MNLTTLSGSKVLASFWEGEAGFDFPVLVLLLAPQLSDSEVDKLCRDARWLDRSTGGLILVVLFWKESRLSPSPSQFDDDTLRNLLLEDQVRQEYLGNLRSGLVDEASAIANALKIPHRDLPCMVMLDNPKSKEFYSLPLKGIDNFSATVVSLRDYLNEQHADYCNRHEELVSAKEQFCRYTDKRFSKKSLKRATKELAPLIEAAGRNADKSMPNYEAFARRLEYFSKNPCDERVGSLLKKEAEVFGVHKFFEKFEQERSEGAEKLFHGASGKDLRLRLARAEQKLRSLERPSLKGFVEKRKLAGVFRTLSDKQEGVSSAVENSEVILKRIVKLAKYLSPLLG